jgi:hypothetical protein
MRHSIPTGELTHDVDKKTGAWRGSRMAIFGVKLKQQVEQDEHPAGFTFLRPARYT